MNERRNAGAVDTGKGCASWNGHWGSHVEGALRRSKTTEILERAAPSENRKQRFPLPRRSLKYQQGVIGPSLLICRFHTMDASE